MFEPWGKLFWLTVRIMGATSHPAEDVEFYIARSATEIDEVLTRIGLAFGIGGLTSAYMALSV